MRWSSAYGYAKERSGAMKPSVKTVEECMKNVLGSVYDKFHLVPEEIVRYTDLNFDSSFTTAQPAVVVHATAADVFKTVFGKCEPTTKELYERYEPVAARCTASAWRRLNQMRLFSQMGDTVVPKAACCMEKCNEVVAVVAEKGCRVSSYLPLVPKEKIARFFS